MTDFRLNDSLAPRFGKKSFANVVPRLCRSCSSRLWWKNIFALFCINEYLQKNTIQGHHYCSNCGFDGSMANRVIRANFLTGRRYFTAWRWPQGQKVRQNLPMIINTARKLAVEARSGVNTIVVDECHRAATDENSKAIDIAPNATLGLSATPEREYDSGFEEIISPILGGNIQL